MTSTEANEFKGAFSSIRLFLWKLEQWSVNVLPGPLGSLSPISQTHTFNKNTNGRSLFMFPNDDANDAVLCVVIRVEMCCFYLGGNMKYFLILWILHYRAQQEKFNWQVLSEIRMSRIFLWNASTVQLKNASFNRQMKKRLLGDSWRYA